MPVKDLNHNIKGHTRIVILSVASTGNKDVNKAPPLQYRIFSPWSRYFVPHPVFTSVIIPTIYPSLLSIILSPIIVIAKHLLHEKQPVVNYTVSLTLLHDSELCHQGM